MSSVHLKRPASQQRRALDPAFEQKTRAGQLVLSAIIGVTTAVGLGLLGVPYFYVLAIIAAVGELIPYLGPMLAAILGVALAATGSEWLALWTAGFYLLQQQCENYLLVPKLMSRQIGLNAATVLIAILVGGAMLGIAGAVLALPTAAILQVILEEALAPTAPTE